jgi:uncharacterized protein YdcH (DUF465 family)
MKKNLFDSDESKLHQNAQVDNDTRQLMSEFGLKEFSERISRFIERAKELKSENIELTRRIAELENEVKSQAIEIENLKREKSLFKKEIEEVLKELEGLDI